jgi:hypothetical protein
MSQNATVKGTVSRKSVSKEQIKGCLGPWTAVLLKKNSDGPFDFDFFKLTFDQSKKKAGPITVYCRPMGDYNILRGRLLGEKTVMKTFINMRPGFYALI